MDHLVIINLGRYAKSVLNPVYKSEGFIDEFSDKKEYNGYPIMAHRLSEVKNKEKYFYFVVIGKKLKRGYGQIG